MSAETLGLYELIVANEHDDPSDTAAAVLDAITTLKQAKSLLFCLVHNECRRTARAATRTIESSPDGHSASGIHPESAVGGTTRDDFLAARFYNGDRYVSWGDATVADHEGRVAFQGTLRSGIDADIERHLEAIADIEAAGVTCLAEIAQVAA